MKYRTEIEQAFKTLQFLPRGNQLSDINLILHGFLDEGFTTQVLSAPTGTGKSIIGAVTAEVLHKIKNPDVFHGASFLLTPTNILSAQYHKTFQDGKSPNDVTFRMLKGAGNFECSALSTCEEPQSAELCAIRIFQKEEMTSIIDEHCNGCDFALQKRLRDRVRHLITNYSYFFVDRMYLQMLAKRTITVFDEAHLLNDLFTEHNAIYLSTSRLQKMVEEVGDNLSLGHTTVFSKLKQITGNLMAGDINETTYIEHLTELAEVYGKICEAAQAETERCDPRSKKYVTLSKMSKKYFGLGCKIGDLLTYNYSHAFEYKPKNQKINDSEDEISVKSIFVGDMFDTLINSEFNLLMSATITEQYANRTLTLKNSKYLRLEPSFPKENKKIVFYKPQNLNYTSLKIDKVLKDLQNSCVEIVQHHTDNNERGILLAPSFALTESISKSLRASKSKAKIYEHVRGEKLNEVFDRFKHHKSGSAVLLTPSGFEGLDLAGDLSRYQIILKAPFGSLGEARMKKILEVWPDIYSLMATMKIVQGAGRSVRSVEDYAVTYMLDSNIQRLWTAKNNEWANEFLVSFTSDLSML
jgi:ATP-dependent DNA helicase DinG